MAILQIRNKDLAVKIIENPLIVGYYLGYNLLKEIHGKWIKNIWGHRIPRTLQAHRGSYKTTSILIVGLIWYLIFNPETRNLICRKDYKNACNILKTISDHYKRAEMKALYKKLYGIDDLRAFISRQDRLVLPTKSKPTPEGNIDACGIDSSQTGNHYENIHTDDIINPKDRSSEAERKRTDAFVQELKNILIPGGVQSNTGTPWHKDDSFRLMPKPEQYPLGAPGLELEEFTPEHILDLKSTMTASLFACNYDLKHIAEIDRIFKDPKEGKWPELAAPQAWLDPAYEGKDHTSLCFIAPYKGEIYIKGWTWRKHVNDLYSRIVELLTQHNAGTLHVDITGDQGYSVKDLKLLYPAVKGHREKRNKHVKIISFGKRVWKDLIWDLECQPEFLSQILDYEEGKEPDDAPDAMACLIAQMKLGRGRTLEDRF